MDIQTSRTDDCIEEAVSTVGGTPEGGASAETDAVIERYGSMVYRIAFTNTHAKCDADDVFQEVFLRYFKQQRTFESEEHRKAWLIRVTVNCCRSLFSSAWFQKTTALEAYTEATGQEFSEEALDLYAALQRLPKKYRSVIYLFYYEDMTTEQIAQALSLSVGNVKVRLNRARKLLRLDLEGGRQNEK